MDRITIIPNLKTVMNIGNITGAESIFLSDVISDIGKDAFIFKTLNDFSAYWDEYGNPDRFIYTVQNQNTKISSFVRFLDPETYEGNILMIHPCYSDNYPLMLQCINYQGIEYQGIMNNLYWIGLSIRTDTGVMYIGDFFGFGAPRIVLDFSTTSLTFYAKEIYLNTTTTGTRNIYVSGNLVGRRSFNISEFNSVQVNGVFTNFLMGYTGLTVTLRSHIVPDFPEMWNLGSDLIPLRCVYTRWVETQLGIFGYTGTMRIGTKYAENLVLITNNEDFVYFTPDKKVGIGTSTPLSTLEVATGDVEVTNPLNGLILRSPNGTRWRVTVDDNGVLTTTPV
jgi:hypothetical protein